MRLVKNALSLAAAIGLFGAVGLASAATISVGSATAVLGTGNPTSPATIAVNYSATGAVGDEEATAIEFEVAFSAADFTLGSAVAGTGFNCDIADGLLTVTYNNTGTQINDGTLCTLTFTLDGTATQGMKALTIQNAIALNGITALTENLNNGAIDIQVATGPVINEGVPAFDSATNVGGGVIMGAPATQNISFSASTGGSNGGTTDLVCMTDIGALTNSTQNNIAINATPATMQFSIAADPMMRTANITCTATPDGGGMAQMWGYTLNIAAGSVLTGPTLTAPATTTVTVGGNLVGGQSNISLTYTAAMGDVGQSTALTCGMPTNNLILVSGGNQNVVTGSQPAPIVLGVVLTDMEQMPAGQITCSANGVDTLFTVNAPAGAVFQAPAVVPTTSLWSQLALIGLLAALGGVIVAVRRNG